MEAQELFDWFLQNKASPQKWDLAATYHQLHPRTIFVKNLPEEATLFDAGAGSGNLAVFKDWLEPKRPDIRMTGISLLPGERQSLYERWMLEPWTRELQADNCDAIYASHFIEHLEDQRGFLEWSAANLKPGGKLYLEWPSAESRGLPSRQAVLNATGVELPITAFSDDETHQPKTPSSDVYAAILRTQGLVIEQEGIIEMPYFTDKLLQDFFAGGDLFLAQAAWFLKTRWCTYIVARKPAESERSDRRWLQWLWQRLTSRRLLR